MTTATDKQYKQYANLNHGICRALGLKEAEAAFCHNLYSLQQQNPEGYFTAFEKESKTAFLTRLGQDLMPSGRTANGIAVLIKRLQDKNIVDMLDFRIRVTDTYIATVPKKEDKPKASRTDAKAVQGEAAKKPITDEEALQNMRFHLTWEIDLELSYKEYLQRLKDSPFWIELALKRKLYSLNEAEQNRFNYLKKFAKDQTAAQEHYNQKIAKLRTEAQQPNASLAPALAQVAQATKNPDNLKPAQAAPINATDDFTNLTDAEFKARFKDLFDFLQSPPPTADFSCMMQMAFAWLSLTQEALKRNPKFLNNAGIETAKKMLIDITTDREAFCRQRLAGARAAPA